MVLWPFRDKLIDAAYARAVTGDFDSAVTMLRRSILHGDATGRRAEAMGFILYQHARWLQAAGAFQQALESRPDNVMWIVYCADAFARANELDHALELLHAAQQRHPDDIAFACARCLIHLDRLDWDSSREAFNDAAAIFNRRRRQNRYSMGLFEDCSQRLLHAPPANAPA